MNIEQLNKDDLLFLIGTYNNYVVDFYEEHDFPDVPVSVYEFLENDFQLILEEQKED